MATDTSAIQTQIVREAPEIEAYKRGLLESSLAQVNAINQAASQGRFLTPGYQIAGMSQNQLDAIAAGEAGIGAYQPFLTTAARQLAGGAGTTQQAINTLAGADTRGDFGAARNLLGSSVGAMNAAGPQFGQASGLIGAGLGQGQMAAQQAAMAAGQQPAFRQGIGALYGAAEQARQASQLGAAPTVDYNPNLAMFQMGPAERVRTQSFAQPGSAEAFMSPYMQNVVDIEKREAQRQADIAGTRRAQAFSRAGAFGGARQAIENAEAQRNLATQMGDIQSRGLQSAFQQGQQQFNTEQQARLAAQQANQQAGLQVGGQNLQAALGVQQLGAQQRLQAALANQALQGQYGLAGAQYGLQAADALRQAGLGQMSGAGQLGQLGLAAAQQQAQAGQMSLQGAQQLASQEAQRSQAAQEAARYMGNVGQGIGALAGQEFGIGAQMAQGLGALGAQQAGMAGQAGALGQASQAMGQQDVNFLYNLGAQQQRQAQAVLDAQRQNQLQQNMQPMQMLGFLSDIYKNAPTTQMGLMQQSQATPSPFQQIAGLGIGATAAAAAAGKAGLL